MAFSSRPITTNEATAALRTLLFGVYNTDGTPKTDLAASTARIYENGSFLSTTTNNFAHVDNGRYSIVLTQAEVNKSANTHLAVGPANAVDYNVVLGEAVIVPSTVSANMTQIAGQTVVASGTVTFPNATLASTTNITAGTITTATNVTTVNGIAANAITATAIAANAITSAKIAADAIGATQIAAGAITAAKIATGAIDADALATDAVTEIANAAVEAEWTALKSLARTGVNGNTGLSITMPNTGAQTSVITTNANAEPVVDFG